MNLTENTSEKLQGELKGMKVITGALIGVLGALFLFCVYGLMTNEDNTFFISMIVVPIVLGAIIPLNYAEMKKIKTELESQKPTDLNSNL
ncbi:hypothetical protein Celal_0651 [Cellulophaga algicola DSM 14237]|uniref:Redox-active disulfide protein 2 n=1 Tax=Cellulophaga algicola (strain DSM 14237 / IC166 / ACAM 630) TaxID=688270 RepID=E6XD77_CELAD|nr:MULTISPECIES: hypothetical protein [Cellulophaga]ADV47990.1 hypothetical protein Celal_0651 [Cellulophaga algicola DSM 14237]